MCYKSSQHTKGVSRDAKKWWTAGHIFVHCFLTIEVLKTATQSEFVWFIKTSVSHDSDITANVYY